MAVIWDPIRLISLLVDYILGLANGAKSADKRSIVLNVEIISHLVRLIMSTSLAYAHSCILTQNTLHDEVKEGSHSYLDRTASVVA